MSCLKCWRDASDTDTGAQGRAGCDCGRNCQRPGTTAVIVRGNSDGSRCDADPSPIAPPWEWIDNIPASAWLATALAIAAGLVVGAMAGGYLVATITKAIA